MCVCVMRVCDACVCVCVMRVCVCVCDVRVLMLTYSAWCVMRVCGAMRVCDAYV